MLLCTGSSYFVCKTTPRFSDVEHNLKICMRLAFLSDVFVFARFREFRF